MFYGEIENLPEPEEGTIYIVSAAAKEKGRTDVVAPATGHPDCKRENGFIVSVPGFVSLNNSSLNNSSKLKALYQGCNLTGVLFINSLTNKKYESRN